MIAIEGRIRDGATGEIMYMFADREAGKTALVDLKSYSWWGPSRLTIDEWADRLVQVAGSPKDQKIKKFSTFELLIW